MVLIGTVACRIFHRAVDGCQRKNSILPMQSDIPECFADKLLHRRHQYSWTSIHGFVGMDEPFSQLRDVSVVAHPVCIALEFNSSMWRISSVQEGIPSTHRLTLSVIPQHAWGFQTSSLLTSTPALWSCHSTPLAQSLELRMMKKLPDEDNSWNSCVTLF